MQLGCIGLQHIGSTSCSKYFIQTIQMPRMYVEYSVLINFISEFGSKGKKGKEGCHPPKHNLNLFKSNTPSCKACGKG
jgi:hypothetical protein